MPDLAGRVGTFERREVDHRRGDADAFALRGRLDRAAPEGRGAFVDPDPADGNEGTAHARSAARRAVRSRLYGQERIHDARRGGRCAPGGMAKSEYTMLEVVGHVFRVANPGMVYCPKPGWTKLDLVEYY